MVPALIFVLSIVWMQLVKGRTDEECQKEQTKRDINFEQAYQVGSNKKLTSVGTCLQTLCSGCCVERG